jgi:hypothetical protein
MTSQHLDSPCLSTSNSMIRNSQRRHPWHGHRASNRERPLPNWSQYRDAEDSSDDDDDDGGDNDEDAGAEEVDVEEKDDVHDGNEDIQQEQADDDDGSDGEDLDHNNEDVPLEKWGKTCKAKVAIVAALKKETSPIHQYIPGGEHQTCQYYSYDVSSFVLRRSC